MQAIWRLARFLPPGSMAQARRWLGGSWTSWAVNRTIRAIPDRIVSLPDGRRFRLGPDPIYLQLFAGRDFEPLESELTRRLVGPGEIVLDIGANFGWYTTLLSRCVGPTGHVLAFEPLPPTYARLRENLGLNDCHANVTAVCAAVGEQRGTATMHQFRQLSHSRSSLGTLGQADFQRWSVPAVDLDSFLAGQGNPRVSFLKCDVEGAERLVLRGARRLLDSPDAPRILIELNEETSAAFGYCKRDLWDDLRGHGYDHFHAVHHGPRLTRIEDAAGLGLTTLMLCGKREIDREKIEVL